MAEKEFKFTQYAFNTIPAATTFTCQEGVLLPMSDGKYPLQQFSYTNWMDECLAWRDSVSIHGGLNPAVNYRIKGSAYLDMMTAASVNTFKVFPVDKARHVILCTPEGIISQDGICMRLDDDVFYSMFLPDPRMINQMYFDNAYDIEVEDCCESRAFYQLCGPRSLEVVEQATRTDLHDLKFMWLRQGLTIAGHEVFILRTGMAGTLGYEVHCATEDCFDVLGELLRVGEAYGIRQLGKLPYIMCHAEGSIPQASEHYALPYPGVNWNITGSLPADHELVYRTPFDNGWEKMIRWNHDFVGKEALQKIAEGNPRTAVTLIWDPASIADAVVASLDSTRCVDPIEWPCDYDMVGANNTIHIDAVYCGDKLVGASSGRMLSSKSRDVISLCAIDRDLAVEGQEVEVLWGNKGTDQVRIKARVSLFPYIKEGRNDNFDIETIPHPVFE